MQKNASIFITIRTFGATPQCYIKNQLVTLDYKGNSGEDLVPDCNEGDCLRICGCFWDQLNSKCKIQRSDQEVCSLITRYYNPLYIKEKLKYYYVLGGTNYFNVLECDDVVGGLEGEYHCLGIVIL